MENGSPGANRARYDDIVRNMSPSDRQRIETGNLSSNEQNTAKFAAASFAWKVYLTSTGGCIPGVGGNESHHPA